MKFVERHPFADPDAAARKIVEIANDVEAVQDARIYIERVNEPFLAAGGDHDACLNFPRSHRCPIGRASSPIRFRCRTASRSQHCATRRKFYHRLAAGPISKAPAWQTAAELLMLIAEHGGDLMMARIAAMRALHRHKPEAAPAPRRKQARA